MIIISDFTAKDVELDGKPLGKLILPTEDTVAFLSIGEFELLESDLLAIAQELKRLNQEYRSQ